MFTVFVTNYRVYLFIYIDQDYSSTKRRSMWSRCNLISRYNLIYFSEPNPYDEVRRDSSNIHRSMYSAQYIFGS